ncbi:ras GTPase activator-like protein [Thermochaetoides thermophila DSM 1495]|uniref:Ras GTPase activator-like protein n=1 Tax=Chaetomium thermophilum (strain DSM 1495 / CBS 144.50 / IMI 039719) TaxID=759272 RepID=G0SF12_CHATD|nr:ras GTPase activator-like protein [Thermochaetoides thermophila DSM 1495]EGS18028.1 ras GTPase activator-like protein [Thermochaetoides thermophila DSM 1495]
MASSYRPHPLRQSQTAEYPVHRQASTVSTASSSSSAYSSHSHSSSSTSYELGRSSMTSSPSSIYSSSGYGAYPGHKRGRSEVTSSSLRHPTSTLTSSQTYSSISQTSTRPAENIYQTARQSLRPLPQTPRPTTPPRAPIRHDRGHSVDIGKLSLTDYGRNTSPAPDTPPTPPHHHSPSPHLRPKSMLLTRADSVVRRASDAGSPPPLTHTHTTSLTTPELEKLSKSSTNQLRTLSKLAQDGADEFAIIPAAEVTGLRGRRRLQRTNRANNRRAYGWEGRNWMDKQRQFLQAYEYLCHIGEAKEWIEDVIQKAIPPIIELEEALRDGVTLAEVVEALNPHRRYKIFRHPKLQYRHSDNIAIFFNYLDEVQLPELFRFELIDLYEKKNIPKVIYCIHALSWLLYRKGIVTFRIGNLVGQLEFEHHELEATQKGLDKLGANVPSFGNMGADFGIEEPPEPEETEEERIERELAEQEAIITDFQAQIRGAMCRVKLGHMMQHLWDNEEWLIDLQSRIRGDFARQIYGYRLEMRRFATHLQAAARGFLVRRRLAIDAWATDLQSVARGFLVRRRQRRTKQIAKHVEKDILKLQSLLRATKVRSEVQEKRAQLEMAAGPIRHIQAKMRGFLVRQKMLAQEQEVQQTTAPAVASLQAAVRGFLQRKKLDAEKAELRLGTPAITELQAGIRAALLRKKIGEQQEELEDLTPVWTALQAAARGKLARGKVRGVQAELRQHVPDLGKLQAAIRAAAVRREISDKLDCLAECEEEIVALQANIRGMLERNRISNLLDALEAEEPAIVQLQAHIRGAMHRQKESAFLDELASHEEEIEQLQALARAVLTRVQVGRILDELDECEPIITELQAAAKGYIIRARFEDKRRHYLENMQKVVKIQSLVRAKLQGQAYKSLISGKNPPVNAVKNFVHLLNDSDFDFNEEVEFERLRKTVVQQVRQNEMLEQYIDQLDIKIALLVKNKITLDEVIKHQHTLGGHASSLLANTPIASTNQFDLKALNKGSRRKLELYQQLFFLLQTQPQYLARLFRRLREEGTPEKECKRIEHLMMGLFGYAQKRREEYYLLKLLGRSIREEVDACSTLHDYLRGSFFWMRLFNSYTRSPRDRKFLRDLMGPLIRDNIIDDPELDLESDPMQIYRSLINNEELRTGRPSRRPLDIPRELAIKDPETKAVFIDHLRDLREICDQFLILLEDLLPRMPYGLRFVCRQTFESLAQRFPREDHARLLQIVSNWLWRFYLQPALTAPENVGVIERQLSPLQKRNLGEVAKVLGQIASGRPFGGENIYLQPLNAFVAESVDRLTQLTEAIISVADAEATFDIDEFNDLYAKNKPTLYIKMSDIFAIHNLVASQLPVISPNRDDIIREIVHDLGSAKHNESEMTAAGSSDIQLFLTPKLQNLEDPDADVKALFMETKRCILYIIRVQTGANLMEILVKPITPEDENKWQAVLREDFANGSKGAYSDANMDISTMSYMELKRTALENVMRLEQMGRITRKNHYQDILNAIALDIRTKSRRRVQRQRELEGVRMTLSNLLEKAKYLEQQRKSYDDYIEQAMLTLQNKKGKKRFLLPFTKQYNHQRELERSGRVPKFGSYKYSARALSDKGVLVSWQGVPERDWGSINLTISCDEVGVFVLEGSKGHIQIPGASAVVSIEDLLQAQFETRQFMNLFEGGALKLNVNLLLHLVYKKFYRTQ